jgi:hypothetical protein
MTDFLERILAHAFGTAQEINPFPMSLFETVDQTEMHEKRAREPADTAPFAPPPLQGPSEMSGVRVSPGLTRTAERQTGVAPRGENGHFRRDVPKGGEQILPLNDDAQFSMLNRPVESKHDYDRTTAPAGRQAPRTLHHQVGEREPKADGVTRREPLMLATKIAPMPTQPIALTTPCAATPHGQHPGAHHDQASIRITIGRIEIAAAPQPTVRPPHSRPTTTRTRPSRTLDEYLLQRNKGRT